MSAGAVRTIVRREVNDTLTDWRILVPIFILTFVLPQLLIAASSIAIDFVGIADQSFASSHLPCCSSASFRHHSR